MDSTERRKKAGKGQGYMYSDSKQWADIVNSATTVVPWFLKALYMMNILSLVSETTRTNCFHFKKQFNENAHRLAN